MSQEHRPSAFQANSALMAGLAFIQRLVGALSTAALAHVLGPASLGAYSISTITANGAYGVTRLGVDVGVHVLAAREDPETSPERLGRILGLALALTAAIAALAAAGCLTLAGRLAPALFHQPGAATFIVIAGVLLFGQALVQCAYVSFAGLHRFGPYTAVMAAGAPLLAGVTVAAALAGPASAAWAAAVGQVLLAGALLLALRAAARRLQVPLVLNLDPAPLREVLKIGLPFYFAGLLFIPVDYVAQAFLARSHGLAALGDLRVVLTAATLVTFLPAASNGPMISALARAHAGGGDVDAAFSSYLRWIWTLGLAVGLALALAWPLLVPAVFGQGYAGARHFGVLSIVAAVGMCLRHVLANSFLAFGRQRLLLAVSAAEAGAFALVAVAGIPRFGVGGYLLAQLAGALAPLVLAWLWASRCGVPAPVAGRLAAAAGLSAVGLGAAAWVDLADEASPGAWAAAATAVGGVILLWPWLVLTAPERKAAAQLGARLARR